MRKGFTLIELLIVIAIVVILAGVVLIAVNPARQMAQARNAERSAEVNAILNAISQYQIDAQALPSCIPDSPIVACIGTGGAASCVNDGATGADACDLSATGADPLAPTYIADIPEGPSGSTADTGYNVTKSGSRVTVSAGYVELGVTISVTR